MLVLKSVIIMIISVIKCVTQITEAFLVGFGTTMLAMVTSL